MGCRWQRSQGIGECPSPGLRPSSSGLLLEPFGFSFSRCVRRPEGMSSVSRCTKSTSEKFDFSIDHILNVAGPKPNFENCAEGETVNQNFEWLSCTRYKPPKLPRQRKKEGAERRRSGRNPRIPFSGSQVALLEAKFVRTPYLSSSDVTQLASYLKLSETRVKIWFQNRRAREKRDRESNGKAETAVQQQQQDRRGAEPAPETHFGFLRSSNGPDLGPHPSGFRDAPLDLSDKRIVRGAE